MRFVTLEVLCFFARVFLVGAVLLSESGFSLLMSLTLDSGSFLRCSLSAASRAVVMTFLGQTVFGNCFFWFVV